MPALVVEWFFATATDEQFEAMAEAGLIDWTPNGGKTGDPWFDDFGK